jgi:Tol biopolymer transport system component
VACWCGAGESSDIWVINSDGSNLRPVTADATPDWEPAWSPDSRSLAFMSERGGLQAVYVKKLGVPEVATRVSPLGVSAYYPVWSPGGGYIAFNGSKNLVQTLPKHLADAVLETPYLWIAPADGSWAKRLTARTWSASSWSPDGRWLTYVYYGLRIVRPDGSGGRRLTSLDAYSPAWSPDGTKIAFIADDGVIFNEQVWTVRPDGTGLRALTSPYEPSPYQPLAWSRR